MRRGLRGDVMKSKRARPTIRDSSADSRDGGEDQGVSDEAHPELRNARRHVADAASAFLLKLRMSPVTVTVAVVLREVV